MTRFVAITLVLMLTVSAVSGCAIRSRHTVKRTTTHTKPERAKTEHKNHKKTPAPPPKGEQLPGSYTDAMQVVMRQKATGNIEDALQKAYEKLEREVGSEQTARITGQDPVFQNEVALVFARKKDLDRAQESLEKAWQALSQDVPVTATTSFNTALYRLEDRLYDSGTDMNPRRDQAIMRAFRDFVFLKKRSERYFVDQVMRRDHRFLPEPAIFPGYFGSIPIEVVNDWYHHSMKTDLLSWRRFAHLPVYYSDGHQRQMKQAIAANLLIIGVLKGDQKMVQHAVQRLEHTAPAAVGSFRYDRSSRGLLMFGHYILGHQEMAMRYEDAVLKNILVP